MNMKYRNIIFSTFIVLLFSSCLKDTPAVDFTTVGTIVEILPPNGGGLENFDAALLEYNPTDAEYSADIDLNIASPKPLNKSITLTLAAHHRLHPAYNPSTHQDYEPMAGS